MNLSQKDLQTFQQLLAARNQESSIKIESEWCKSIRKTNNGAFQVTLATGDSFTLYNEKQPMALAEKIEQKEENDMDVQAKAAATLSMVAIDNVSLTEWEQENAVDIVKTTNKLQKKGVPIEGLSGEEILALNGLMETFETKEIKRTVDPEDVTTMLVDFWKK